MHSLHALKKAIVGYEPEEPHHRLHGRARSVVRITWVALAILTLTVFIVSIPAYLGRFDSPVQFHAGYGIALDIIQVAVFCLAATAIFWLKSNDRMAVFVSTALLMFGVAIVPWLNVLEKSQSGWRWPALLVRGLGLGLTITRRLVALHRGSMTLESQPEQGSTFHVYLPLPSLSDQPAPLYWSRPNRC